MLWEQCFLLLQERWVPHAWGLPLMWGEGVLLLEHVKITWESKGILSLIFNFHNDPPLIWEEKTLLLKHVEITKESKSILSLVFNLHFVIGQSSIKYGLKKKGLYWHGSNMPFFRHWFFTPGCIFCHNYFHFFSLYIYIYIYIVISVRNSLLRAWKRVKELKLKCWCRRVVFDFFRISKIHAWLNNKRTGP